jgi:hypothetical protein
MQPENRRLPHPLRFAAQVVLLTSFLLCYCFLSGGARSAPAVSGSIQLKIHAADDMKAEEIC